MSSFDRPPFFLQLLRDDHQRTLNLFSACALRRIGCLALKCDVLACDTVDRSSLFT